MEWSGNSFWWVIHILQKLKISILIQITTGYLLWWSHMTSQWEYYEQKDFPQNVRSVSERGYSPSDKASQSNRWQGQLTPASSGGLCQPLSHPMATSSPGVCSNSCPLSRWCHPTISSSVTPFSSCLQSFPTSGSFHRVAKGLKNQYHSFQ